MVVGKPYIHFKINNEPLEVAPDYNYTWATTVEATKGPVNEPTLISTANQALAIFGIDMRPYFAQGAGSLIVVRVAAKSDTKEPAKGLYSFVVKNAIQIYRTEQKTFTTTKVYKTEAKNPDESYVVTRHDDTDDYDVYEHVERTYTHKLYYVDIEGQDPIPVIEHRDANGKLIPGQYITTWHKNGRVITEGDKNKALAKPEHTVANLIPGDGMKNKGDADGNNTIAVAEWDEEDYKQTLTPSTIYRTGRGAVVKPWLEPKEYTIQAGTSLFDVTSKYEGDYNIVVSVISSATGSADTYTIVLTDPSLGSIRINNAYDPSKIVNRINDRGFNFVATLTNAGRALSEAIEAYPSPVTVYTGNTTYGPLVLDAIPENVFIAKKKHKTSGDVSYLTKTEAETIKLDEENGTTNSTVEVFDYSMNLASAEQEPLIGSSNGEWDYEKSRIPVQYQYDAHKNGLDLLRRLRIAGVFCMYGENNIQKAYIDHGIDPTEPEKGMNNNETCKWRTILLGVNENERDSKASLASKASALNDQYTLLLGQGLIDSNYYGVASAMSEAERRAKGIVNEHQLLPYECTPYIAGLRSKLGYDESIFGGQNRKRIRGAGGNSSGLEIAPLFDYDDKYDWDPKTYAYLNESGVLTFTEEYGNITLTDGVTTCQTGFEEDEEGVMNILKYAQNGIYNICLPYIGRNINADLEQGLRMEIQSFLEVMKSSHQSLIDTDEFNAYEFSVSLGARNTQLLGKIFIYLKITPVHALRQIEVEMTVQ